jgi:murein DD-endopeptidase MepM/ murein hydrolase activator NlpD
MDIISYQIAGTAAVAAGAHGRGAARSSAVRSSGRSAGGFFARLGVTTGVLRQYRQFFALVTAGAVIGCALAAVDAYCSTFARTVDLAPYARFGHDELDSAFERVALGGAAGSSDVTTRDELALFYDTAADGSADFVFTKSVAFTTYTVQRGDTISGLSVKFGLKYIGTLIAANNISNVRGIQAGQKLTIPSIDGLNYTVKARDTLAGLSSRYNIAVEDLLDVNDLASETLAVGQVIFVPGAQLDSDTVRRALGELFASPLRGRYRLTSGFGYRADPFTGVRQHHNGLDMAAPSGTPVRAAMSGRVVTTAWSNIYGNYIIINHGNGYQTLYGHLSKIQVAKNQAVTQGGQIGLVGTTGYSTGPHLHFTVYRNGTLINPTTVLRL